MTHAPATLANLTLDSAAATLWDVLVIGAGPSGAFAALRLAQAGARVLLVERKAFPRDKVCGGCVSRQALALLQQAGLAPELARLPGLATRRLSLYAGGRATTIEVPEGLAVRRRAFDAMLVDAALAAGAAFLPQTTARVAELAADRRTIDCRAHDGAVASCAARVVLVAEGLSPEGLPADMAASRIVSRGSRIGVGAALGGEGRSLPDDSTAGTIHMSVGKGGYVGLVRTETNRAIVAAAIDPKLLSGGRSPAAAVAAILDSAGRRTWAELAATDWLDANWHGTPTLTRRLRRPAAPRLLALGDAAGYVEPFTGEGIGWGIASAENVAPLALEGARAWSDSIERRWLRVEQSMMERRRRFCRIVSRCLRSPLAVGAAMRVLSAAPGWSAPFVRLWNRPLPLYRSMMQ